MKKKKFKNPVTLTHENIRRWIYRFFPIYLKADNVIDSTLKRDHAWQELKRTFAATGTQIVQLNPPFLPWRIRENERISRGAELINFYNFYIFIYDYIFTISSINDLIKINYWNYFMKNSDILNKLLMKMLTRHYDQNEILQIQKDWWGFWIRRERFNAVWNTSRVRANILKDNYDKLDI